MTDRFFTGKWQSKHHALQIEFNENVWRLVHDGYDEPTRALFGLFSENDGASFSLDYSHKDAALEYDFDFAEAEFFSRMFNLDNQCKRLSTTNLLIENLDFICGRYLFHNEKYGLQTVTRAMHINQTFVIAIGMAWPAVEEERLVIPKFQMLIDHLHIHNQ